MSLQFDLTLPRRNFALTLAGRFNGETVGIFGPSGAGKTSFFNLLCGLEKPAEGRVILNGRTLCDTEKGIFIPPNLRGMGVVFQEKRLFPHMSVKENLLFGERYVKHKRVTLETVVELLDLGSLIDSMPNKISGGEQQRTAIGRALLTSPEILLLDEPFSAVDKNLRMTILPYLKRLRDELKIPLLVISHDMPDIQRLTNTFYLIDKGKCIGFGDIFDMFHQKEFTPESVDLVNTFPLYDPEKIEEGLYVCRIKGNEGKRIFTATAPGNSFTMVVKPEEIAISLEKVPNISIQNQFTGRIEDIVFKGTRVYCLIDAGMKLVAKITPTALHSLGFKKGDNVFCLFKAHSLSL